MNPANMLTMARPIASNLSAVPSDASPQLRPGRTKALNRAAETPAHATALIGAANCLGFDAVPTSWTRDVNDSDATCGSRTHEPRGRRSGATSGRCQGPAPPFSLLLYSLPHSRLP
jgi:hypothetical protein